MTQVAHAIVGSVNPVGNVYFDGRCVSHSVQLADGSHKSVGVVMVGMLTFKTGAAEKMEIVGGQCRVRLFDAAMSTAQSEWQTYGVGQSFSVPANSGFDIDVTSTLHYICHFG